VDEVHEKYHLRVTKRERARGIGEDVVDVHVRQGSWKRVQTVEMGRFRGFVRSLVHALAIRRGCVSPDGWVARLEVSKLANEDVRVLVRFI
jgi:hypothetical protein